MALCCNKAKAFKKNLPRFFVFLAVVTFGFSYASAEDVNLNSTVLNPEYMAKVERLGGIPMDAMRSNDALLFQGAYGAGGDLFQQFVRFLFPVSGREKRVMFLPLTFWDPKKPRYKKLEWKRYESDHFDFYAYPEARATLNTVIKYYEEEYDRNNRVIGLDSKFTKKIPVIFYQTRRDFEQTAIVDGPIPEGLGGLTEILSWRRVTFPFEGEWSKLEHVAKHEGTHVFQIAKKAKKLPLWFIEGSAETNSIYWDSDADMLVRDAFLNGFFFHIQELWQIEGTWLMYKIGNFICNVIWDEYGEEGFRRIYDNATRVNFETNLQDSLGISLKELDQKVQAVLQKRYGHLLRKDDIISGSKKIVDSKLVMASFDRFFVSGGFEGSRNVLFINHLNKDGKLTTKQISEDKTFENESFEMLQKGAFLTKDSIVYSVKKSALDELRIIPYSFDEKKRSFTIGEEKSYSWKSVDRIQDPVLVGPDKVAFIGYHEGFSDLYTADLKTMELDQLTKGRSHYSDLDYSAVRNEMIYSKEGARDPNRIFYNRDLFTFNLKTRLETQLTDTPSIVEVQPRFSPDGTKILYIADPDHTYDIFLMDLKSRFSDRLTRMNVGARSPQWSINSSVLFNGFKQMSPTIYLFRPDDTKNLFARFGKSTAESRFIYRDGKLLVPDTQLEEPKHDELVLDGLYLVNENPVVRFKNRNYTAHSIATLDHRLVLKTQEGLPNDTQTRHEVLPRYFELDGKDVSSLKSMMVAEEGISEDVQRWAELQLNGRDIVQSWFSQDHQKALLTVNNRLAAEYDTVRKKPQVSLFVYDLSQNHLEELKDGPIRSLDQTVQWVSFLDHNQIFLAVGAEKMGPFETYVYSMNKKTYQFLDREMFQFRISKDQSKILWKGAGYKMLDIRKPSKDIEYTEIKIDGVKDKIEEFEFDSNDNPIFFSSSDKEKKWKYTSFDPEQGKYTTTELVRQKNDPIQKVTMSKDGIVAVQVEMEDKKDFQQIWIWNVKENKVFPMQIIGDQFSSLVFRKNYLTFFATFFDPRPPVEYFWSPNMGDKAVVSDNISTIQREDQILIYEGDKQLCLYDQSKKESSVVDQDTMGFYIHDDKILYSSKLGFHYQISEFNLDTRKKKILTFSAYNKWKPTLIKNDLIYIADKDGLRYAETQNTATGEVGPSNTYPYDVQDIKNKNGDLEVLAEPKSTDRPQGPLHPYQPEYPTFLHSQPIHNNLRLQNLAAAAAYDGDEFRYFFSAYADNLFSDKGMFINSLFLGDSKFATIGYSDLNSGLNASFFYNLRDGIENMGVDLAKNIVFDRYRQLTPYVDFEYQGYSSDSSTINSFVEPSFDGEKFYLVKLGGVYSYDATIWDRHGPANGVRLYFRGETGFDTEDPRVANADANIDVRIYHQILPRFGFAHRLTGGTSQGPIPNIYLLGGNMSFRGVGFDDLVGQNYWAFSEDMRIPVFDFLGAKFFDPLDSVLGFFTRYFDVRAGIYTDVGATWMNGDDPDLKYSVGYFVNIPTMLGLIVRLNQGFAGEKKFGIWFGSNW